MKTLSQWFRSRRVRRVGFWAGRLGQPRACPVGIGAQYQAAWLAGWEEGRDWLETKHADLNASETILYRGLQLSTPKDTRSGSACGVLCAKQDREAGNESRKARSPVIHDGE